MQWVTTGATALLTGALGQGPSTRIRVPVLFVLGSQDHVVCGTFDHCQNKTQVINAEKPSLPNAPCVSAIVTPNAGHSMNLEKTAPTTTNTTLHWMKTHTPPQTAPQCG